MITHNNILLIALLPFLLLIVVALFFIHDMVRFYRIKLYIKNHQKDLYDLCKSEVDNYIRSRNMISCTISRNDIINVSYKVHKKIYNIISEKKIKNYNIDDIILMQIKNTIIHLFIKYNYDYPYYDICVQGWEDLRMYKGE